MHVPGINLVLKVNYTLKTDKFIEKEIRFWDFHMWEWEGGQKAPDFQRRDNQVSRGVPHPHGAQGTAAECHT